jgi:hypothetical protein
MTVTPDEPQYEDGFRSCLGATMTGQVIFIQYLRVNGSYGSSSGSPRWPCSPSLRTSRGNGNFGRSLKYEHEAGAHRRSRVTAANQGGGAPHPRVWMSPGRWPCVHATRADDPKHRLGPEPSAAPQLTRRAANATPFRPGPDAGPQPPRCAVLRRIRRQRRPGMSSDVSTLVRNSLRPAVVSAAACSTEVTVTGPTRT